MKLSDLAPNPENPRKISDEKLKMLQKSLHEFGDLSGVVFNRTTGRLVGGHQRARALPAEAAIELDQRYESPSRSGTVAEGHITIEGEKFKYREVIWDETKEKAANIAANQHGGEWDIPKLNEWLIELDAQNVDMDLVGFDAQELNHLLAPIHLPKEEKPKPGENSKQVTCPRCGELFDGK